MPNNTMPFIFGYLAAINLVAIIAIIIDKRAARYNLRRISEKSLLFISVLGGSVFMLLTMQLVRHKTKHAKFTIGIPVIIVLQLAACLFVWWRLNGGAAFGG
jgi:uncharacterized membrane protein YsdA (DUF1294 family)